MRTRAFSLALIGWLLIGSGPFLKVTECRAQTTAATWTELTVSGPLPLSRKGHTAVYDPQGQRMIVFGGWSSVVYNSINDVWSFDLTSHAWTQVATTGGPPPNRAGHVAVYDSQRHRMIVFGGSNWWLTYYNDLWALNLSTGQWSALTASGSGPSPRFFHCGIYDSSSDRLIVFGGHGGGSSFLGDVWALQLGTLTWNQITAPGPSPRFEASAVLDAEDRRMILFGGRNGSQYFGEVWQFDLDGHAWTLLGSFENTVACHAAVVDPVCRRMIAAAGWGLFDHGQAAVFSAADNSWLDLSVAGGGPSVRQDPSLVWDPVGRRAVLFGGDIGSLTVDYNDTWELVIEECGEVSDPRPLIQAIVDVPNDQGRQVSISWSGSAHDVLGSATPILQYAVYRRIDEDFAGESDQGGVALAGGGRVHGGGPEGARLLYPPGRWHFLLTVPARCETEYATVAPTLVDSTIGGGLRYSTFFVSALTATPGVYFDSPPDSGYSVDNLAPGVPGGFAVAYGESVVLSWQESADPDWRYFKIYRGATPDFVVGPGSLVHETTATGWTDPAGGYGSFYRVSAVDFSGNESAAAAPAVVTGVGTLPAALTLLQNVPNPFKLATSIGFDLAADEVVTLRVHDLAGRLVRTLLAAVPHTVGRHKAIWNGTDETGRPVAAGVYIYWLEGRGFSTSRRMALVR